MIVMAPASAGHRCRLSRIVRPTPPGFSDTPARATRRGARSADRKSSGGASRGTTAGPRRPTASSGRGTPSGSSTTGFSSSSSRPSASQRSARRQSASRNPPSFRSVVSAAVPRRSPSQMRPSRWPFSSPSAAAGGIRPTGHRSGGAIAARASAWRPPKPQRITQPADPRASDTKPSDGRPAARAIVTRSHTSPSSQRCPAASTRGRIAAAATITSVSPNGRNSTAPSSDLCHRSSPRPFSTTGSPAANGSGRPTVAWRGGFSPARASSRYASTSPTKARARGPAGAATAFMRG